MSRHSANPGVVREVEVSGLPEAIAVLCEAFFDYPTLRFVLGDSPDYAERLATLVGLFIDSTVLPGGTVLALADGNELIAVADTVPSWATEPPALAQRRATVWELLGGAAQKRYAAYSEVRRSFEPAAPHYYLSMLGVRPQCSGRGLARPLLEAIHALSRADARSTGVALETEDPRNVAFYEHFGYRLVGQQPFGESHHSWGFFRPD